MAVPDEKNDGLPGRKRKSDGRTAPMDESARRAGKSAAARESAEREHKSC